jgi:Ni/Co efflux regulator RcnB
MKKFIALLISASLIAAPVAFADDQSTAADQETAMQKMSSNDQATASAPAKVSKRKARCHCSKCHHGNHKKHGTAANKKM